MKHRLFIHVGGPDLAAIGARIAQWPWFVEPPAYLEIDDRERKATPAWREQLVATEDEATADWDRSASEADSKVLTLVQRTRARNGIVLAAAPAAFTKAEEVLALLEDLPFEVASFRTVWPVEWKKLDAPRVGFGQQHAVHGWACAFRGAGHDRLVSRRWLDHGPWRVLRGSGDLSLVLFHDLDATPADALAQAAPAHVRMGNSDTGGYLQAAPRGDHVEGLYDAGTRTLEIVVAGRQVPQAEMLAACAVRRARRADPDKPIERIAYVFLTDAEARVHSHELWLRELECWSVEGGDKHRMDPTNRDS